MKMCNRSAVFTLICDLNMRICLGLGLLDGRQKFVLNVGCIKRDVGCIKSAGTRYPVGVRYIKPNCTVPCTDGQDILSVQL
jgi:hypothetical protein